ncbi:MAG TPA: BadF/BadG/BcrA/BcrD ATPase family protein [Pyrinomonadaceae bacterium]|nr:BadF/BadG/BcrA/BcrD ATPase family protein [Pyrinomonadaceae bacterium]
MNVILAIDGGGSRTRCVAFDECGNALGSGESGPSNHLLVEDNTVAASINDAISDALAASNKSPGEVSLIAAGLAGVDYDGSGEPEMRELFRDLGYANTLIEGDMVMAHSGALAGDPGVLALAGTGSSVLGIGQGGERVKVGGWGPVFGDEGSAYRIGESALRAAARDFDGRGPKTALTEAITKSLKLSSFEGTVEAVYVKQMAPREIALLSKTAYEVAGTGDEVARGIFEMAGTELAECVASAVVQLGPQDGNLKISYEGSVITSCELMRDSFCGYLSAKFPSVAITRPRFSPVVGAYLLGRSGIGLDNDNDLLEKLEGRISNN